ncbi:MAG: STE24 endopeptidase [Planctomycetota bacterium]|jgi:STE24 endopeptidase
MNSYAILILVALVVEWLLNLTADSLNLRALSDKLPEAGKQVYDGETYRRSQEYTRAKTRFGRIPGTVNLVLLLGFWYLDGFAILHRELVALNYGSTVTGLLFIGALIVLSSLANLPFRYYSTFVIEERFGFNRTTRGTFFLDMLKGAVLGTLLAGPLLAAVLALFEQAGDLAWLWCWIFVTVFTLIIQYIAPTWIFPLFNKFKPLEDGELKQAIMNYAERVGFPLSGLFVIDGSRRSSKANAFFTGFGRNKRVALFDTLIEKHETDELVAVVAHEVGHFKRKHILKSMVLSIAHTGVLFWLLSLVLTHQGLFEAFSMTERPIYAGFVFFSLIYTPVEMLLSLFLQAQSRRNEFEADAYAAETTGTPEALAAGLLRLSSNSLSNLTPHPFYVALHHSHPPVLDRVAALRSGT